MYLQYYFDPIIVHDIRPGDVTFKLEECETIRDDIGRPLMSFKGINYWNASLDGGPLVDRRKSKL